MRRILPEGFTITNPSGRIHESSIDHTLSRTMKTKLACNFDGCYEKFDNKSSLRRHRQVHSTTLRYKCDKCPDKKFKFLQSLQKHKRLRHAKEARPIYVCGICQRTTVDFTGMRYHLMRQHELDEKDARFEARGMICRPVNLLGLMQMGFKFCDFFCRRR